MTAANNALFIQPLISQQAPAEGGPSGADLGITRVEVKFVRLSGFSFQRAPGKGANELTADR